MTWQELSLDEQKALKAFLTVRVMEPRNRVRYIHPSEFNNGMIAGDVEPIISLIRKSVEEAREILDSSKDVGDLEALNRKLRKRILRDDCSGASASLEDVVRLKAAAYVAFNNWDPPTRLPSSYALDGVDVEDWVKPTRTRSREKVSDEELLNAARDVIETFSVAALQAQRPGQFSTRFIAEVRKRIDGRLGEKRIRVRLKKLIDEGKLDLPAGLKGKPKGL